MALDARIDRLEEALTRLARAQARSEAAVLILTREVDRLRETLRFTLEERAREVVPRYLVQHHRIHVPDLDSRTYSVSGEEVVGDLYGEGQEDFSPSS